MAITKKLADQIYVVETAKEIIYTPQILTEEQRAAARENVGANWKNLPDKPFDYEEVEVVVNNTTITVSEGCGNLNLPNSLETDVAYKVTLDGVDYFGSMMRREANADFQGFITEIDKDTFMSISETGSFGFLNRDDGLVYDLDGQHTFRLAKISILSKIDPIFINHLSDITGNVQAQLDSKATRSNINTALNRTNAVNAANTNYTTYMARGESLNSSETNPTANGTIAWTYE